MSTVQPTCTTTSDTDSTAWSFHTKSWFKISVRILQVFLPSLCPPSSPPSLCPSSFLPFFLDSSGYPGTHDEVQVGFELRGWPASLVLGLKSCATVPNPDLFSQVDGIHAWEVNQTSCRLSKVFLWAFYYFWILFCVYIRVGESVQWVCVHIVHSTMQTCIEESGHW